MFRRKTVFVVGAGASCELGFPSGAELLQQIAGALDIRFESWDRISGDDAIYDEFRTLANGSGGSVSNINPFLYASWRIRDAAHLGISIDNVLSQNCDDPLVATAGKIAIARLLLEAERQSALHFDRRNEDGPALNVLRDTWLGRFSQLLVQDYDRSNIGAIFEDISIISFNYDRSIVEFMPYALQSQFGVDEEAAQTISRSLRIHYPYGSLGPLPWQDRQRGTPFGSSRPRLSEISKSIRTYTEQIEDEDELAPIASALNSAERIVFLGFGYHRQNIDLLRKNLAPKAAFVVGTSYGLSKNDCDVVQLQLNGFLSERYVHRDPKLESSKCVKFLDENFRSLTQ